MIYNHKFNTDHSRFTEYFEMQDEFISSKILLSWHMIHIYRVQTKNSEKSITATHFVLHQKLKVHCRFNCIVSKTK